MTRTDERRALVIGASGGIGGALCAELEARGLAVTGLSRRDDGLEISDEDSVARLLGALEGIYEVVFVATGALTAGGKPPEKSLRQLEGPALAAQFAVNAIGPALVLKHAVRLLPRDRRAVVAVLSARVGSIGDNRLGGWYGYRAAKAALNQLVHGAAVELARSHRHLVLACLHPGTVETAFTRDYPDHAKVSPAEAARRLVDVAETLEPARTGGFYDYAGRPIPW